MKSHSPKKKNTNNLTLRHIEPKDNPTIARIIREVMTGIGCVGAGYSIADPELDSLYQTYQHSGSRFFMAELDGAAVGGAGIAPLKGADPSVCELQKMYILPTARGQGVGHQLMQACLHFAREHGYTHCYLETLERLGDACRLYQSHGFQVIPQAMGNTGHHSCNHYMLKTL